jgi:hypothetical protein
MLALLRRTGIGRLRFRLLAVGPFGVSYLRSGRPNRTRTLSSTFVGFLDVPEFSMRVGDDAPLLRTESASSSNYFAAWCSFVGR